jgi:GNAT superfamily N-acetyltransferase
VEFRLCTTEDAIVLASMNQELIRDEGHRNRMTLDELTSRMKQFLQSEYEAVLFLVDDCPVGYGLYKYEPEWVYLRQFFVKPDFRRRGIGREATKWLREEVWRQCRRVRLDVLVGNCDGIAFWRAVGFEDYCLTMELEWPNAD